LVEISVSVHGAEEVIRELNQKTNACIGADNLFFPRSAMKVIAQKELPNLRKYTTGLERRRWLKPPPSFYVIKGQVFGALQWKLQA
jgi:hypothetical protein